MRLLGIDYGSKRVGLALSDESGVFAFPYSVVPGGKNAVPLVAQVCKENAVEKIVIGESLDYKGNPNKIMPAIIQFAELLGAATQIPVVFEREFLTTREASHIQGEHASIDASAAALILKSYIDRQR